MIVNRREDLDGPRQKTSDGQEALRRAGGQNEDLDVGRPWGLGTRRGGRAAAV